MAFEEVKVNWSNLTVLSIYWPEEVPLERLGHLRPEVSAGPGAIGDGRAVPARVGAGHVREACASSPVRGSPASPDPGVPDVLQGRVQAAPHAPGKRARPRGGRARGRAVRRGDRVRTRPNYLQTRKSWVFNIAGFYSKRHTIDGKQYLVALSQPFEYPSHHNQLQKYYDVPSKEIVWSS